VLDVEVILTALFHTSKTKSCTTLPMTLSALADRGCHTNILLKYVILMYKCL